MEQRQRAPQVSCGEVVVSCDSKRRNGSLPRDRADMIYDESLGFGGVENLIVFAVAPHFPHGDQAEFPALVGRDLDALSVRAHNVSKRVDREQPIHDLGYGDRLHIILVRVVAESALKMGDRRRFVFDDLAFRRLGGYEKRRFRLPFA